MRIDSYEQYNLIVGVAFFLRFYNSGEGAGRYFSESKLFNTGSAQLYTIYIRRSYTESFVDTQALLNFF